MKRRQMNEEQCREINRLVVRNISSCRNNATDPCCFPTGKIRESMQLLTVTHLDIHGAIPRTYRTRSSPTSSHSKWQLSTIAGNEQLAQSLSKTDLV